MNIVAQKKSTVLVRPSKNYTNLHEWQLKKIQESMSSVQLGKVVDGDTAMEWFNSLGTKKELPIPTVS